MTKDKRIEIIKCECGCGQTLNKYDGNYRTRTIINGHNNRKYNDPLEYKKVWWKNNKHDRKEASRILKKKYRNEKKIKLLNLRGNKCISCNLKYDGKNASIFDFHHINPLDKKFNLNAKSAQNKSYEKLIVESKKCVILCSNCHRLHHHTDTIQINKDILND